MTQSARTNEGRPDTLPVSTLEDPVETKAPEAAGSDLTVSSVRGFAMVEGFEGFLRRSGVMELRLYSIKSGLLS